MLFTKDQRIQISRRIVEIPQIQDALNNIMTSFDNELVSICNEDDANKSIMDSLTSIINEYQNELSAVDGDRRLELDEQDLLDSVSRGFQNFFYPNDMNTPSLLYTSPSPRDRQKSRMPSSA